MEAQQPPSAHDAEPAPEKDNKIEGLENLIKGLETRLRGFEKKQRKKKRRRSRSVSSDSSTDSVVESGAVLKFRGKTINEAKERTWESYNNRFATEESNFTIEYLTSHENLDTEM